ncbi:MAG: 4-hydroxy-3-methylbut-2-enyl diphosphate reductase [Acidobacteriota bacterium]|nr:4-hydroxy-3-methylbut-2-enyl diphosphate reductase [Acidobacteriota bacterium]
MSKKIVLCKPNGFCAGVDRAIKIVDLALDAYGPPIYVNHEIVHNHYVVDSLTAKGAVFVDDLDEVPVGERLIYSAHGVSPEVREKAKARNLRELDATCPLVTKVHMEAVRFARRGYHIFLIGHADHVEVIGTYGEVPESITIVEPHRGEALHRAIRHLPEPPTDQLIYLTQTTLNVDDCLAVVDALQLRFPTLVGPPNDDICYATTNRQYAVKAVAEQLDFFVVVGAPISSNSKRLVEVAKESGCKAQLFQGVDELKQHDLSDYQSIGITAGASTPDILVQEIIAYLTEQGFDQFEEFNHVEENLAFTIPYHFRKDLEEKGISV